MIIILQTALKCAKSLAFLLILCLIENPCSALANKQIEGVYPIGEKFVDSSRVINSTRILSRVRKREDPGNKILTKAILLAPFVNILNLKKKNSEKLFLKVSLFFYLKQLSRTISLNLSDVHTKF